MTSRRSWRGAAERMADVGRQAVLNGLALASGGNLSIRRDEEFIVTKRGGYLDRITTDDLSLISMAGEVIAGPEPSSEWKLHHRTYLSRPDVRAIVHAHPQHVVLLDALNKPIRLLTLDHVAYVGHVERVPFLPNGSDELADAAAEAASHCDCVVLAHHGCSTVSTTLEDAYRKAINLESAAIATFRMLQLGDDCTEFPQDLRPGAIHG